MTYVVWEAHKEVPVKERLTMSEDMLGPAVRKLVALPSDALGTAIDLLTKMADPNWRDATKRFLRKEEARLRLRVWRPVKIGEARRPLALIERLEEDGFGIHPALVEMIRMAGLEGMATESTYVDLVKVSKADLGLRGDANFIAIFDRALELGLKPCHPEVALELRRAYAEQPKGEDLCVVCSARSGFLLARDRDGMYIMYKEFDATSYGDDTRGNDLKFVFVAS